MNGLLGGPLLVGGSVQSNLTTGRIAAAHLYQLRVPASAGVRAGISPLSSGR